MGRFVDRIRAKREMKNNPVTVSISTDRMNDITRNISGSYQLPTFTSNYRFEKPDNTPQQVQDWQRHGFKSQDDMDFWVNRAKSWSGGVLDTIDKVKQFQRENGLVDDGKVGWRTIEVFNSKNGVRGIPKNDNVENNTGVKTRSLLPASPAVVIPEENIGINYEDVYPISGWNRASSMPIQRTDNRSIHQKRVDEANRKAKLDMSTINKIGDLFNDLMDWRQKNIQEYNENIRKYRNNNGMSYSGSYKKGGTIKRFQQGGELTPNDIESRLQYYSRIGYPVDGRIGDVNIGTISGEVPYTKYNAQTVKGANGMEMGQSDENMKFIQYVKDCIGVQDDNSLKQAIQSLGEKGIKALQQAYKRGIPAQQVRKQLMGQQAQYAKRGGCLACQKNGGRFAKPSKPELQKANAKANVNQMPVLVNSMKCGGKAGKKMLSKKRK